MLRFFIIGGGGGGVDSLSSLSSSAFDLNILNEGKGRRRR